MARSTFGAGSGDSVTQPPAPASPVARFILNSDPVGTFWDSQFNMTGQYTDLLDAATGQPIAGLSTDQYGRLKRFQGPDGVMFGWVDFGAGRVLVFDGAALVAAATAPTDSAVASAVKQSGSATQVALDARYPGKSSVVSHGDLVINVKDYGAKGDGTTLDHVAINNAITAGAGRTVYLPSGTYLIDATAGIKMWTANVKLLLDAGAKIKAQPNGADGYSMVEVNAADCVIEGGTIEGDGTAHTGTTGQQGHCITTAANASRLIIRSVRVQKAWGDGIAIQGGAADVSVIDVTADDNRRQGMSIIQSTRTRVIGGVYKNTGLSQSTSPTAGIDVEPNAGSSVTDCVISNVLFYGNKGPGMQVATATGTTVEVTVTGCRSSGSTASWGFYLVGPDDSIKAKLTGCHALNNALHGFAVNTNKVELTACTARGNTQYGFQINANDAVLNDPVAVENGRTGIQTSGPSVLRARIVGGVTRANSQTTSGSYINVDNFGVGTTIIGHLSDAGQLTNKPAWGYAIRTSSTARLIGCEVDGTFTSASLLDQPGNTFMVPRPGSADPSVSGATTTTTAPAAGAAGALPTAPAGYYQLNINGTVRKIPYY